MIEALEFVKTEDARVGHTAAPDGYNQSPGWNGSASGIANGVLAQVPFSAVRLLCGRWVPSVQTSFTLIISARVDNAADRSVTSSVGGLASEMESDSVRQGTRAEHDAPYRVVEAAKSNDPSEFA
ncbi:hypothetical protein LA080_013229 [Diaporthe eres]|nr:hypothetical protein LA080_013229 [Diaporthe eres]